jgi:hypothetical protein
MPKYSAEDLDSITTWTGNVGAVCLGIASTLASILGTVPGNQIMGMDKTPIAIISIAFGGVGTIALGIQSNFTNKTATTHPTQVDLENEVARDESLDFLQYGPNPQQPSPYHTHYTPPFSHPAPEGYSAQLQHPSTVTDDVAEEGVTRVIDDYDDEP